MQIPTKTRQLFNVNNSLFFFFFTTKIRLKIQSTDGEQLNYDRNNEIEIVIH